MSSKRPMDDEVRNRVQEAVTGERPEPEPLEFSLDNFFSPEVREGKRPIRIPASFLALGVPCNKVQSSSWWRFKEALMMPPQRTLINLNASGALTDTARNQIARDFWGGEAEWLFFLDDDVILKEDTVLRMLETAWKFKSRYVVGVYHRRSPLFEPLVFHRNKNGTYHTILDLPDGPFYVDSAGLGCALIHKSLFKDIRDAYQLVRINGVLVPVLKTSLVNSSMVGPSLGRFLIQDEDRVYVAEQGELVEDNDEVLWPFFAFHYMRTEDHHWNELCGSIGVQALCDPAVQCGHLGETIFGRKHMEDLLVTPEGRKAISEYYKALAAEGIANPEVAPYDNENVDTGKLANQSLPDVTGHGEC